MSRTYEQLEPVIGALDERIKTNLGAFPTDTAEGSIVSFPDGADGIPLKSLVVDIDPVQSGSGDPSPDNVRPISGWSEVNVEHTGKNLLKVTATTQTVSGTTFTVNDDGSVTVSGTPTNLINGQYVLGAVALPAGTYKFNGCSNPNDNLRLSCYNVTSSTVIASIYNSNEFEFTLAKKSVIRLFMFVNTTFAGTAVIRPMVRLSSITDATYEPYSGQNINIPLGQTVYGGKLDVLSGVLTVDMAMVDLGTLTWSYVNGAGGVKFFSSEAVTNAKRPSANAEATGAIFSTYATISAYDVYLGNIGGGIDTKSNVRIYDPNYTDAAAFKAAMSGVQFCYELAEPLTIQLTPHEVKSLLGQNNIFADTGDSAVEYRADTKLYIERLTEPDADMIADANITSGSYFMVGNSLYLATANIASGSAVIEGTNATRKSLSEALNEINQ